MPGNAFEISQPIQLRFNELISGVRSDLGIKVYGDDLDQLLTTRQRDRARACVPFQARMASKWSRWQGFPMLSVEPNRPALYRYGLNVTDVQDVLAAATGGEEAGQVFEGDRRFALVVRLPEHLRSDLAQLSRLPVPACRTVVMCRLAKWRRSSSRRVPIRSAVRTASGGSS